MYMNAQCFRQKGVWYNTQQILASYRWKMFGSVVMWLPAYVNKEKCVKIHFCFAIGTRWTVSDLIMFQPLCPWNQFMIPICVGGFESFRACLNVVAKKEPFSLLGIICQYLDCSKSVTTLNYSYVVRIVLRKALKHISLLWVSELLYIYFIFVYFNKLIDFFSFLFSLIFRKWGAKTNIWQGQHMSLKTWTSVMSYDTSTTVCCTFSVMIVPSWWNFTAAWDHVACSFWCHLSTSEKLVFDITGLLLYVNFQMSWHWLARET
jgi:hypothetical protein